mmetsp:Transcript_4805/g.13619  ORF Transcript_4805/g.13619 Transcript_4805/m.13619 type:complete len:374 (-) Transcript_4805:449-1570(-)
MMGCGVVLALGFDAELVRIDVDSSSAASGEKGGGGGGGGDARKGRTRRRRKGDVDFPSSASSSARSYDSILAAPCSIAGDSSSTLFGARECKGVEDCLRCTVPKGSSSSVGNDDEYDEAAAGDDDGEPSLLQVILSLFRSTPFVLSVALSACMAGCIVFNLYFVTQYIVARGLGERGAVLAVSAVFVTSPGPGTLVGAWIVQRMGGYDDHLVTFGFALATGLASLASAALFPLSRLPAVEGGGAATTTAAATRSPPLSQSLLVLACWLFFFTGGMSAAPLNGVAVSAVPRASHVASCVQFSLQNAAKIVVPQLGGYVVDRMGLPNGFDATTIASVVLFILLGAAGLVHAERERRRCGRIAAAAPTGECEKLLL